VNEAGGGIAHTTHLGGLVVGYLYLKTGSRTHVIAEIKYRYLKWRINRMRRKFDVYSGGRADDVDRGFIKTRHKSQARVTIDRQSSPRSQSCRTGLKTSSSNVSSSASAWWGKPEGMCSTSPSRTVISSPPTTTFQRALEDVGHLLALVRMHRHERAALEINLREHLPLAGDDLLRDHLGDLLECNLVPAVKAHGGHGTPIVP
jgi:hypothetical protein